MTDIQYLSSGHLPYVILLYFCNGNELVFCFISSPIADIIIPHPLAKSQPNLRGVTRIAKVVLACQPKLLGYLGE